MDIMDVMGIQSGRNAYAAAFGKTGDERMNAASAGGGDVAKAAMFEENMRNALGRDNEGQPDDAEKNAAWGADEQYPLEAYRIPNWYAELTGGYTMLTAKIGSRGADSQTGYSRLCSAEQRKYDEYMDILSGYYRDALAEAGISKDTGDYYHNLLQNPATQEQARKSLYEHLSDDPRAMELMRHFGVEFQPI